MVTSTQRRAKLSLAVLFLWILAACSPTAATGTPGLPETGGAGVPAACQPTEPDMLGPFYVPGAPERDRVGEGYVLSGSVLSAGDCSPVENAQVEFWMVGPDGEYADEFRAIVYSGTDGAYSFESHSPPGYAGRPPHIHVRVTAPGFKELVTQHYPEAGAGQAVFDLVLDGE